MDKLEKLLLLDKRLSAVDWTWRRSDDRRAEKKAAAYWAGQIQPLIDDTGPQGRILAGMAKLRARILGGLFRESETLGRLIAGNTIAPRPVSLGRTFLSSWVLFYERLIDKDPGYLIDDDAENAAIVKATLNCKNPTIEIK